MILNKSIAQVQAEIAKNFVYMNDVAGIIMTAATEQKGLLLYGRGGHGKSEVTDAIFNFCGLKPFVMSCGEGLSVDQLFGGLNMKEFKTSGKIHYNVQDSFMNHEVVVFEELLDTPSGVLLELKDVLTRGWFKKGSQIFELKTKVWIGLTNKTREEYADDNSIRALLERFPLGWKVEWNTYTTGNFMEMFKVVFKNDYSKHYKDLVVLAELIVKSHSTGKFISPRTAVYSAQIMLKQGMSSLKYVDGIDTQFLEELKKKAIEIEQLQKDLEAIKSYQNQLEIITKKTYKDVVSIVSEIKNLKNIKAGLGTLKVNDKAMSDYKNALNAIDSHIVKLNDLMFTIA